MERKKFRVSGIDVVFVVLILAVVLGAYWLIHRDGGDAVPRKRSYVIELTELDASMADAVAVGDTVTDNVKNYHMGTVTDVTVTAAVADVLDEESGILREAEVPGKITLLVTVEADTTETDQTITTTGGFDLRIGTSVSCSVGGLTATGFIVGLDR